MKSSEIRQSFLDFFAERGHKVVPSAPLVPHGDPTLLFTNAGMVPFKNYFLGAEAPPQPRATTSQKCLRVSGKHNDLENVGPSPRHHTFFEMLGNFSFGDYFKRRAIELAWEYVTEVLELPVEHLYATVFEEDDEARSLWLEISSLPPERVIKCGAADNFWSMGETGPCGPCSEIMVDRQPDQPPIDFHEGAESGRYLEIWNLVFMQFERDESGEMTPLPNPSIDTGAGLERLAAVLQEVESNYDTDLFRPILERAAELSGNRYGSDPQTDVSLRVIGDHLRAVTFLLADGVIPSNEGRGYVLRRILRRAVRHGLRIGFEEPFLHRLVPVVGEIFGDAYPELAATESASQAAIEAEESKFLTTVASGARQVQEEIEEARRAGSDRLAGGAVFRLYDTYGLPIELIREIAEEERIGVDEEGFATELGKQRERSRKATGGGQKATTRLSEALRGEGEGHGKRGSATPFAGYGATELDGVRVERLATEEGMSAAALGQGERGAVRLDRTVFYAESGGQIGDVGLIRWDGGTARVTDTQKDSTGLIVHRVEVGEGRLTAGTEVSLAVDAERRRSIERNHTATHLLHAALREELGEGARQAGSLVAPDRLRFDFTHGKPVPPEKLARIEARVNEWVLAASDTAVAERGYEEAIAAGAMALFGEKYGDRVRTVEVPGVSLELCGGCHVANTGQIGLFLLTSEKGIASGVRRIEAITGQAAYESVRQQRARLEQIADSLGGTVDRAADEVVRLKEELKARDAELGKLRLALVSGSVAGASGDDGDSGIVDLDGVGLLVREVSPAPAGELRNMADALRSKVGSGAVVLGVRDGDKVTILAAVTADLAGRLHAGQLVKAAAAVVGGGGGGRPDFAQAGGREPDKLPEALAGVEELVREQLAKAK